MTVEVYLGKNFRYNHERKAFGVFLEEMLDRYEDTEELYLIIVEPEVNTAAIDLLVITPRALIVIDLKNLGAADDTDPNSICLSAKENGVWKYRLPDGKSFNITVSNFRNPYQQLKNHGYKLRDWLVEHPKFLPNGPWTKQKAERSSFKWVVISPGFNPDESDLDLPWEIINKWFKVISLKDLAYEIYVTTIGELDFTKKQILGLAEDLGV